MKHPLGSPSIVLRKHVVVFPGLVAWGEGEPCIHCLRMMRTVVEFHRIQLLYCIYCKLVCNELFILVSNVASSSVTFDGSL